MLTMIILHSITVLTGIALIVPDIISIKEDLKIIKGVAISSLMFWKKNAERGVSKILTHIFFTLLSVILSVNMFTISVASGFGAGFSISLVGIAITLFFQWKNGWDSYKLFRQWLKDRRI